MNQTEITVPSDEEWQGVNHRKNKRNSPITTRNVRQKTLNNYWLGASTSNQFDKLAMIENFPTEIRPPPIFVYGIENIKPLTDTLEVIAKNSYVFKIIGTSQAKIQLKDSKNYSDIIKILDDKKTEFYFYLRKEDNLSK